MGTTVRMTAAEACSAAAIQAVIDGLGPAGGTVELPAMELELDRGIELRSGVTLAGQGADTVLRMKPGRVYPLSGYHNYGMRDVPLQYTDGLEPGMTVALRDSVYQGFFETLAVITWVRDNWVGLDTGLASDYLAENKPLLITSFPLVFGRGVERVAVRDLTLDGNRQAQPGGIGACRGAAVYFIGSSDFRVTRVTERGFAGEGLGFQMCAHGEITDCRFTDNAGNGYHPGAGSTGVLFRNCVAEGNKRAGFFFCVRANHITVEGCSFDGNVDCGVSVGTRDCMNLLRDCTIRGNEGPGILFRDCVRPVEVHSCVVERCRIEGNARLTGKGQIDVLADAHDLILRDNVLLGAEERESAGVYLGPATTNIWLSGNTITGCFPDVIASPESRASQLPAIEYGLEAAREEHFRHLARTRI